LRIIASCLLHGLTHWIDSDSRILNNSLVTRIACLDLPAFPLQLVWRDEPAWRAHPVVVVDEDRPQGVVRWACESARACGVLAGLYARRRTGAGQSVATSLLGAGLALQSGAFVTAGRAVGGPVLDAEQTGYGAAYRLYRGRDGEWFAVAVPDARAWEGLRAVAGVAGLPAGPPPLRTEPGDPQPAEALLAAAFATRDASAWVGALRAAGVPVEPVHDVDRSAFTAGIVDDPVNLQLGRVVSYAWDARGWVDQPRLPPRIGPDAAPGAPAGIPGLGEHTAEVLAEVGVTPEELAGYLESGTVVSSSLR